MFASAIVLRYRLPNVARPFRLGNNFVMWCIAGVGFLGSLLAFVLSFIPPAQIAVGSKAVWFSVLIGGAFVVIVIPLIIYSMRKPQWKSAAEAAQFAKFYWEK